MLYSSSVVRVLGAILLGVMGWFSGVLDGFGAADPPETITEVFTQ